MNIPCFRGVFMRNKMPSGGPRNDEERGIVNLDNASGPGTHWVAYKKRGSTVVYFDSYGNLKPPLELQRYFKNCKIIYNTDLFQTKSYNCGHLCLEFLSK